jgi:hypothetical protein
MGTPHAANGDRQQAGWYEIRLRGHLDARWAVWFDGMTLTREGDGTTHIGGPVVDQAALHGCSSGCATSACRCSRSGGSSPRR